jgi:hypothetical protein
MSRHRLAIAVVGLIASLVFPREAGAGLMEIIWEMSGPSLVGALSQCRVNLQTGASECRIYGRKVSGNPDAFATTRVWLLLENGLYVSTGRNTNNDYSYGDVAMAAFDPLLEVRSGALRDFQFHHGVGLSYNFLVGEGFRRFNKVSAKLRPLAFTYKRFNFAYNLRLYESGFTSQDFGLELQPGEEREFEIVHGLSIGVDW